MVAFPTALDNFVNPAAGDFMNQAGVEGDVVTSNLNDAVEALEAKVGITNSADPTSLDYLVASLAQMGIKAKSTPRVTTQAGIANGVDVDGTEVTFTAVAGRQYIYVLENLNLQTTVQSQKWGMLVLKDGTQIGIVGSVTAAASDQLLTACGAVRFEGSGSVTLKTQASLASGSGTIDAFGSSASPVRAFVQDIGSTI